MLVLGTMSNEVHAILPHLFMQGHSVNTTMYIRVLDMLLKPWIKWVAVHLPVRLFSLLRVPHDHERLTGNFHVIMSFPTHDLQVIMIWILWVSSLDDIPYILRMRWHQKLDQPQVSQCHRLVEGCWHNEYDGHYKWEQPDPDKQSCNKAILRWGRFYLIACFFLFFTNFNMCTILF